MKCMKCNHINNDNDQFCTKCGSSILSIDKEKKCNKCGNAINSNDTFCSSCGTKIGGNKNTKNISKTKKRKLKSKQKELGLIHFLEDHKYGFIVGVLIAGFIIIRILDNSDKFISTTNNNKLISLSSSSNRVLQIANKFICSCGTCGEQSLDTCTCPTAESERRFIAKNIADGYSDNEIIRILNKEFGWLKSEYKNLLTKQTTKNIKIQQNKTSEKKIATQMNEEFIIKQFKCPCGQCGIDELIKCGCDHPKGAKEVKGFIANQIKTGNFTVDEIIENTTNKYGGEKIRI